MKKNGCCYYSQKECWLDCTVRVEDSGLNKWRFHNFKPPEKLSHEHQVVTLKDHTYIYGQNTQLTSVYLLFCCSFFLWISLKMLQKSEYLWEVERPLRSQLSFAAPVLIWACSCSWRSVHRHLTHLSHCAQICYTVRHL